jgi:hypothetical protein
MNNKQVSGGLLFYHRGKKEVVVEVKSQSTSITTRTESINAPIGAVLSVEEEEQIHQSSSSSFS